LEPSDDPSFGNPLGRLTAKLVFVIDPIPSAAKPTQVSAPARDCFCDLLVLERRPPVCVLHHKLPRFARNVVRHKECSAQRSAAIRRRWLDEDLTERRLLANLTVGYAIQSTTTGKTKPREPRAPMDSSQDVKENLLENRLQ
jgi:hypothetical protein